MSGQAAYLHFLKEVADKRSRTQTLRYGQIMFNMLTVVLPAAAEELRATNLDPFYKEESEISHETRQVIAKHFKQMYGE